MTLNYTGADKQQDQSGFYVDRELVYPHHLEGYDRKGRFQRTYDSIGSFIPAMGTCNPVHTLALDP